MEYRLLGRTGVRVSKLCLGCWMFGLRTDEAESVRMLHAALDAGINFLDTSNRYGRDAEGRYGASETFIGRALKERGSAARDQVVLATKVFGEVGPGPNDRGHSRLHITRALEDSLRRLQTDHVDLYYLHWPDQDTPLDQPARAMDDLIRAGKVRYWATSNHPAWKVTYAHWLCERYDLHPPVAEEPPYSLLRRDAERELLPCARELGFAVVPYSPLAGGLLSGKYRPGQPPPPESRATWSTGMTRRMEDEQVMERVAAVQRIADDLGRPMTQVAINWVAAQPGVTAPIIGPRTLAQLHDNAGALEWDLQAEVVAKLSEITAG
jgi:aryl-alcohol dehydrogenase-like predicted oxidoreductase